MRVASHRMERRRYERTGQLDFPAAVSLAGQFPAMTGDRTKFVEQRPYADPEPAARKLVELASVRSRISSRARQRNTRQGLSVRLPRAGSTCTSQEPM